MLRRTPHRCAILAIMCAASACSNGKHSTDAADASLPITRAPPSPPRDWTTYPPIVELDTSADIYAVGDVHGDYDLVVALLIGAGLMPAAPTTPADAKWSGNSAVLVSVGDLIDKYSESLEVLTLFQALRASASSAGGAVIVTSGNHEAELLANPTSTNTTNPDFIAELNDAGIPLADIASGANPYGAFLRNLPFAARVRDWFFCHAGNTQGASLADLATALQTGVDAQGWGAPILSATDSLLEARLSGGTAPWWEIPGLSPSTTLTSYASALDANHIVMGHQPGSFKFSDGTSRAADALTTRFGVLFFIDVGLSRGVDGTGGPLLHISTSAGVTTATTIDSKGATSVLWSG